MTITSSTVDVDRLLGDLGRVLDALDADAAHRERYAAELNGLYPEQERIIGIAYVNECEASRLRHAANLVRDAIERAGNRYDAV